MSYKHFLFQGIHYIECKFTSVIFILLYPRLFLEKIVFKRLKCTENVMDQTIFYLFSPRRIRHAVNPIKLVFTCTITIK